VGFFKRLFGWIGSFFKEAAKTAVGVVAEEMKDVALQVVREAENAPNKSSKYEYAFRKMRDRYPDARTAGINLAIELAVAIVDPKQ